MITTLAAVALALASIPGALYLVNLVRYRPAPPLRGRPGVSLVIPARDEEAHIGAAVDAALASEAVDLEVLVLDDGSTDRTAEIVRERARRDPRVRLLSGRPLPAGWNGKQHAAHTAAQEATRPWLAFADADLRLEPDALNRLVAAAEEAGADLVSGIPRQRTVGALEQLVISLIPFVLLGFLPMGRMRRSRHPSYGAGVGQLFVARAEAYHRAGGHGAIRSSRHDGLALPRAFRQAGSHTDLVDLTELATVRMYTSASEVWWGFVKNADEGLARPAPLPPVSLILVVGQVLPFALLAAAPWLPGLALLLAALAALAAMGPRLVSRRRFHHTWLAVLGHPLAILLFLAIQWHALARSLAGRPASWKGRSYALGGTP